MQQKPNIDAAVAMPKKSIADRIVTTFDKRHQLSGRWGYLPSSKVKATLLEACFGATYLEYNPRPRYSHSHQIMLIDKQIPVAAIRD